MTVRNDDGLLPRDVAATVEIRDILNGVADARCPLHSAARRGDAKTVLSLLAGGKGKPPVDPAMPNLVGDLPLSCVPAGQVVNGLLDAADYRARKTEYEQCRELIQMLALGFEC